jgi:hypothetical protein
LHTNGTREGLGFTLGNTIPHMDPMLLPLQDSKKSYRYVSFNSFHNIFYFYFCSFIYIFIQDNYT